MFNLLSLRRRTVPVEAPASYPENTTVIWNKGLAMCCDHYCFAAPFPQTAYQEITKGDVVWLQSKNLAQFVADILPTLKNPFTLVTTYGTRSMPAECGLDNPDLFISDDRLVHWFTQNLRYEGRFAKKISPIPIGIDFHSQWEQGPTWRFDQRLKPSAQEASLMSIRKRAPLFKDRLNQVYSDFHFNNSTRKLKKRDPAVRYDRKEIYALLKNNPAIMFQPKRIFRHLLWEQMAQYRFVISPHGVGLDCHRTWEALVLGCCVIVMTSSLDSVYEGLPVIVVDDYREITPAKLNTWSEDDSLHPNDSVLDDRLTNAWWMNRIRTIADRPIE